MANAAERVYSLIRKTVEEQGVSLWDVRFVKEGASWYLRIYIDKPDGITIDDCTNVSHAVDPIIDSADPIDVSYYLEVCSPGIERELTRPEHYAAMLGKKISVRLDKAKDGTKELTGLLKSSDKDGIVLDCGEDTALTYKEISKSVVLYEE